MRVIDIDKWPRRAHYLLYSKMEFAHFGISANVDITVCLEHIKKRQLPFFISVLYLVSRAANDIPEFRYRIRGATVIEHETVAPAFTLMTQQENLFTFCTAEYYKAYADFRPHADTAISAAKQKVDLEESPERDDLIYVTSIPWISFTSLMNPVPLRPIDSFPRIAWGKYFEENGRIKLPLHLQVHHGLMDGFHAGQFFNALQEMCDHPEKFLE